MAAERVGSRPSPGRPLGAWAVGRPTLHGGPVRLRPVRVTSCSVLIYDKCPKYFGKRPHLRLDAPYGCEWIHPFLTHIHTLFLEPKTASQSVQLSLQDSPFYLNLQSPMLYNAPKLPLPVGYLDLHLTNSSLGLHESPTQTENISPGQFPSDIPPSLLS